MTQRPTRREDATRRSTVSLADAGRVATTVGTLVTGASLPLAVAAAVALVVDAPTLRAGLDAAVAATTGPLALGGGAPWLLHVGAFGVLAGAWILGVGFVLSGLVD